MPELLATLDAMGRVEKRKNRFMAALQGIDIDKDGEDEVSQKDAPTVEDIQARALKRLTGDDNVAGAAAAGINPEMGVEYKINTGGVEIG